MPPPTTPGMYCTRLRQVAVCLAVLMAGAFMAAGQPAARGQLETMTLGDLADGRVVKFVRPRDGVWGIEIGTANQPRYQQTKPVQIELYKGEQDIRQLAAGYDTVRKESGGVVGRAKLDGGGDTAFTVTDRWTLKGKVLSLDRKVAVTGAQAGAGFLSAIRLQTPPQLTWPEASFLAPGLLYGDPTYDGPASPGGTRNQGIRRFWMREDYLPAPLFGMSLRNGDSLTVLDAAPRGNTTMGESRAGPGTMIDERFLFGAMGANESADGGIEVGFWLPGTTSEFPRGGGAGAGARRGGPPPEATPQTPPTALAWRRRYHPVRDGFAQSYQVAFRFGTQEAFPDLTRESYRWAWQVLKPAVNWQDLAVVRRSLSDQLSSQVYTIEGRTGLPFIVSTVTGQVWSNAANPSFYWRATMGFVGKNLESADHLLCEAERDPSERGQKMRQQALDIIATFIRTVSMTPPTATGVNLKTGEPSMTNPPRWYLREATEDMYMLMQAYNRERKAGHEHPEWVKWCRDFADWALTQQRPDGSFPRGFQLGTGQVIDDSGTTSYNVVPLFLQLSENSGEKKYREAATRAAEYVWQSFGTRGVFIGGAVDNPNITDKEAGMLSMEAFLALYEATHEAKWLARAQTAGNFAESWMWLWNIPMPDDANDAELHWKKNVPVTGVQGITAQVAGHVDQFLDWSVPAYAKLYRYTGDEHYRDLTRILLHNPKAMLSLPGRLYGMVGPGWQQENWRMGAAPQGRGFGTPEKWMPWVTCNHLYSIYGLEDYDAALFKELSAKPR